VLFSREERSNSAHNGITLLTLLRTRSSQTHVIPILISELSPGTLPAPLYIAAPLNSAVSQPGSARGVPRVVKGRKAVYTPYYPGWYGGRYLSSPPPTWYTLLPSPTWYTRLPSLPCAGQVPLSHVRERRITPMCGNGE